PTPGTHELHRRDRRDGPWRVDGRRRHLHHPDPGRVPDLPASLRAGDDRERAEVIPPPRPLHAARPPALMTHPAPHDESSRSSSTMSLPSTIAGVVPALAQDAGYGPQRSGIVVAALMPYTAALCVQTYRGHRAACGTGVSRRRLGGGLSMERVPGAVGGDVTYTTRFVHFETGMLVIGPHVI